ncbi:bis(5'-nucleosyl)-tetraphosphatase (symmetrical) YqeK [Salipaludibacillus agaradhaerens]|uniref:bis(5'-nucleosyl)-tetraphosphatase (symmetrical) n=1 Tax=Salipaludibacillus agaradhaerens TaxID=76935 RepID=A0A9Q4G0A1_SALAG|nr:bis(5'-nucleosyl)-tetraphosphatase (symmetrical) YqeK [Salipaludibacillus agaradhaerens]MCR6098266.1 bis(5'-nucleosyl)-tetraphosphatase (symmetrical) YqeK [Salipaludibacillus agaradhaerens]MCR6116104.1 bis(5'-nucleosyl)-tetraphosphatase (symmetrical) YqeK [Salipaludibacillus agaradhaerens]
MEELFKTYTINFNLSGDLEHDVTTFLTSNKFTNTARHSCRVGREAERLAHSFNYNGDIAKAAGLLHDISAVFPTHERAAILEKLGLVVLKEEKIFPLIAHQRLSRVMAEEIFNIQDEEILSAIECHTTLKGNASKMDQIVFVADKIEWDQPGEPPYINRVKSQLEVSIGHAAFAYINYLWERKENLKVIHPWLTEAYEDLKRKLLIR